MILFIINENLSMLEFSADELTATAYWKSSLRDLPLAGMDTNACNFMTCPVEKNVKTTYNFNLEISKKFPTVNFMQNNFKLSFHFIIYLFIYYRFQSSYNIKWKFAHGDKVCCAYLKIALIK